MDRGFAAQLNITIQSLSSPFSFAEHQCLHLSSFTSRPSLQCEYCWFRLSVYLSPSTNLYHKHAHACAYGSELHVRPQPASASALHDIQAVTRDRLSPGWHIASNSRGWSSPTHEVTNCPRQRLASVYSARLQSEPSRGDCIC